MTQTEMPSPNHSLFVQVLAQIEREPETWDQDVYRRFDPACGTAHCFAGWAVSLSGCHWDSVLTACLPGCAEPEAVDIVANRLLGVDGWAPHKMLFHGDNDLDDLYRISADILGIDETVLRDKVAAEVQA